MKKLQFIGAVAISMSIIACSGDAKTTDANSSETTEVTVNTPDYKGMEMINLADYNINASIYIPDENKGPQNVEASETESVNISVGDNFGIEVIPFGLTVADQYDMLAGDLVYEIEYIEETANKLVYKKTIKDSEIEPEFHFFLTTEINGEPVTVRSMNKAYSQKLIEKMIVSAESLKSNDPA